MHLQSSGSVDSTRGTTLDHSDPLSTTLIHRVFNPCCCPCRSMLHDSEVKQTLPLLAQHSTGSRGMRGFGPTRHLSALMSDAVGARRVAVKAEKPALPCGCVSLTEHSIRCAPSPTRVVPVAVSSVHDNNPNAHPRKKPAVEFLAQRQVTRRHRSLPHQRSVTSMDSYDTVLEGYSGGDGGFSFS